MSSIFFAAPLFLALSLQSPSSQVPQRQLPPVDKMLAQATQALREGHLVDAHRLAEAALKEAEKDPNNPQLGKAVGNLASLYFEMGDTAKAVDLAGHAVSLDQKAFGTESSRVAGDLSNLAMYNESAGKQDEAEKYLKQAIAILDKNPDRDSFLRMGIMGNLAELYSGQRRYAEAERLAKGALDLAEGMPDGDAMQITNQRHMLAHIYELEGRDEFEIARLLAGTGPDVVSRRNAALVETLKAMNLADHYREQGSLKLAEENYLAIADAEKVQAGGYSEWLPGILNGLGETYHAEHKYSDAEETFKRAIALCEEAASNPAPSRPGLPPEIRKQTQENDARGPNFFVATLLNLYREQGRLSEIEPVYLRVLGIQETVLGPEDAAVGDTAFQLAQVYCEEEKYEEALPLYRRTLLIQEKNLGPGHQNLATTLQQYAGALRALGEDAEAKAASARADAILNQKSHEPR